MNYLCYVPSCLYFINNRIEKTIEKLFWEGELYLSCKNIRIRNVCFSLNCLLWWSFFHPFFRKQEI